MLTTLSRDDMTPQSLPLVPHGSEPRPRIAVVGDIMLDVDHHCSVTRLAQEGPWPVFKVERTERRLGGAGNVARMLVALDANVLLCGLAPHETLGDSELMNHVDWGGLTIDSSTQKTRLLVEGRYAGLRLDHDSIVSLDPDHDVPRILERIRAWQPDAAIVADHGKGVVTARLMEELAGYGIPLFVDPQATTPLPEPLPVDDEQRLVTEVPFLLIGHTYEMPPTAWSHGRIVKHGANGIDWQIGRLSGHLPSTCRSLVDPLGAGDQFIATLTVARMLGHAWFEAISKANHAAGLQCERAGCIPVIAEECGLSSRAETRVVESDNILTVRESMGRRCV